MSIKNRNINHRKQNAKSKFQQHYNNVLNWEAHYRCFWNNVGKTKKLGGEIFPLWSKGERICVFTCTRYSIYYILSLMLNSLPAFFVVVISHQDVNVLIHVCGF